MATFLSYNSTGINSVKCQFINDLSDEYNVNYVAIQEHFKCTKNTDKFFRDKFGQYYSYVIPGHRTPGQEYGRAKAGLAQLSRKSIDIRKDRINTRSFRIQAQVLNFSSGKILWVNTYLPTDPQTVDKFDDTELLELLNEIETILTSIAYTDVIWAGDLNWDMTRSTAFSKIMKEFTQRMGLVSLWSTRPVNFTHVHTDNKSVSTVDHFIVNPELLPRVCGSGAIQTGDNLSRHSPIWLKIDIGEPLPLKKEVPHRTPRKPSWPKASLENIKNFTDTLSTRLSDLVVPDSLGCSNCQCTDPVHSQERDSFTLDILLSMVEVTHTCLPLSGGRRVANPGSKGYRAIPGWHEYVEPFRVESRYWHNVWLREGRPSQGWLHQTMVKKKSQYHYAIRRLKNKDNLIRAEKLFEASMKGDLNLLSEMKSIRCGGYEVGGELPETVDGANGETEIVEKFKDVYSALYNSAASQDEMVELMESVQSMIKASSMEEVKKVTGAKVKEAVSKMRPLKADVSGGFTSDALLNAPDILFDNLAAIYRSWLVHGTVSQSLLACAFLPLLKSSLKNPADPSSYRAIAGSSLLLKLFEKVVLLIWGHILSSDSLQFGFKSDTSTTQCSWLVQEVVGHFLRNGSNPILAVLDCSKAFDTCKFGTMFTKLVQSGLPPVVVRTLMVMYEQQFAWVRWGRTVSNRFTITNGTRQGSVASPVLWCIYLDMLITELREQGLGCHVGGLFMGVVVYADDILLMAPTRSAMQAMLNKCEDYAVKNNIMFSTDPDPTKSKTKCIFVTGTKRDLVKPDPLTLSGRELPWVVSANHLGHILHESGKMEYDTSIKRATFIDATVQVREMFKFASPVEVLAAFKVFCCSFYGCMLWDLGGEAASKVFRAWSTAVKLAWEVPRGTRTFLMQQVLASGLTSARVDILARFPAFFRGLVSSPSKEVSVMANLVGQDLRSVTGQNLRYIEECIGSNPVLCSASKLKEQLYNTEMVETPGQDSWRLGYLSNLLQQRQVAKYLSLDDRIAELTNLIDSLCIN